MLRRVGENRRHLFDGQPKIGSDVVFVYSRFPVFHDVPGKWSKGRAAPKKVRFGGKG